VIERRATPVERIVDRALSLSSVSHGQIGERADDLAREMREAMTANARNGLGRVDNSWVVCVGCVTTKEP
jgi:hypothetical protein